MSIEIKKNKTKTVKCDIGAAFANAVSSINDFLKENCMYYHDGSCLINCMSLQKGA